MAINALTADSIKQPGPENTLMAKANELVSKANAVITDATADGSTSNNTGLLSVISVLIPNAATQTYTVVVGEKMEIVDVVVLKDTAGAGNTIQLFDSASVAISDAIAAAVDKAVTRAGTLDVAKRTVNAASNFKITATRAAGSMACLVLVYCLRRA